MAERWRYLADLRAEQISAELDRLLSRMVASERFRPPTFDVSSFLEQILLAGFREPASSAGVLVKSLQKNLSRASLEAAVRPPKMTFGEVAPAPPISPGLAHSFERAFQIRRRTGGKDAYIGVRHVIMAIFTESAPVVSQELGMAIAPVGMIPLDSLLTDFVTGVIIPHHEPGESLPEWASVLAESGHTQVANLIANAHDQNRPPLSETRRRRRDASRSLKALLPASPDAVAVVRNDDPSDLGPGDIIGHDRVAVALARVLAAKSFKPPLAVGVFGPWGSGKSLFMRRVHAEVDRLVTSRDDAYHQNIPEVRFNAWHYVDGDLWASLVGHIFETLEKHSATTPGTSSVLLDRLTTARELSLASARDLAGKRDAARSAQEELQKAEQSLQRKREDLITWIESAAKGGIEGLKALSENRDAKALVEKTYGRLPAEMVAVWSGPEEALSALRRDGAVLLQVKRELGSRTQILSCIIVAFLLLSMPIWLGWLSPWVDGAEAFVQRLEPIGLAITGLLTTAAGWLGVLTKKAVAARDAVVSAAGAYKSAVNSATSGTQIELNAKLEALGSAHLKVEESKETLNGALATQAEAASAFAQSSPAERLKAFVKARASIDGPYRSRQGLVGTIRRDFADLADLMMENDEVRNQQIKKADAAYEREVAQIKSDFADALTETEIARLSASVNEGPPGPRIDRIVLYIDDLDRCPFDKVMEVLQAVHLLMAFRLFVVLVAVDVRWLETTLEESHKQFGSEAKHTSAIEYLEKIFQLAIWTQALGSADAAAFIHARLPVARERPRTASQSKTAAGDTASRPAVDSKLEASAGAASSDPVAVPTSPSLELSAGEADFLTRITAPFGMSPRRLLRFLNSYQVARTALADDASSGTNELYAFAAILALAVARPELIGNIAERLDTSDTWVEFTSQLQSARDGTLADDVKEWAAVVGSAKLEPKAARQWVALALRFGFKGVALRRM